MDPVSPEGVSEDGVPAPAEADLTAKPSLVIGASSQVGRFLLPRLVAEGFEVDALSRGPKPEDMPDLDGLEMARVVKQVLVHL